MTIGYVLRLCCSDYFTTCLVSTTIRFMNFCTESRNKMSSKQPKAGVVCNIILLKLVKEVKADTQINIICISFLL